MMGEHFWDDKRHAQTLINHQNRLIKLVDEITSVTLKNRQFLEEMKLLKTDYSDEMHQLYEDEYQSLKKAIEDFEIEILLNQEYDSCNAILEIHPGAGGTESQDWAEMLFRMYIRYAEKHNLSVETLDYQEGDEAGIKSVSFIIKGPNAYGYLRSEKGVHRLVRISPFDASKRRHTSFASVDVMPELIDNNDIVINEDELRIDTYRASGAGGQHINKTDSAVRITHLPTNIVVSCQSQRSQIQNKEQAMNALRSKLYQKAVEEKNQQLKLIQGEQKSIEWGSQIRSYVFCPYCMVKDHRSDYETGDSYAVMDGNIDGFIYAYLKMGANKND